MTKQYVLGIDPSGAYKEGKGTTGFALLDPDGAVETHAMVQAKYYATQEDYWKAVLMHIEETFEHYPELVLSVEDYVLYANSAKAQINSEMETSKLIGAITMLAYDLGIPMYIRNASQVMHRWTNEILAYKNLIKKCSNRWHDMKGRAVNGHILDALRHAVHCYYFDLGRRPQ